MNTDGKEDDAAAIFDRYSDFSLEIVKRTRGIKLRIRNAPAGAFVDRRIIEGIRQHLFAVLRDLVYIGTEIEQSERFDLGRGDSITDAVFHILKHAGILNPKLRPNLVVCWGGHATYREPSTNTPKGSDITWGCAASTCAPGVDRAP